jgi:hypothetical protein
MTRHLVSLAVGRGEKITQLVDCAGFGEALWKILRLNFYLSETLSI